MNRLRKTLLIVICCIIYHWWRSVVKWIFNKRDEGDIFTDDCKQGSFSILTHENNNNIKKKTDVVSVLPRHEQKSRQKL